MKERSRIINYTVNKGELTDLYISVQNGEIVVNAPWDFGANQIQEILEEKKQWLMEKLQEYQKSEIKEKEISLLGKKYTMIISFKHIKSPNISINNNTIDAILPIKYKKNNTDFIVNDLANKIYSHVAENEIETIMEKARFMLGFAPDDYIISSCENFIAKCYDKKIIINPSIVMYDTKTIEYIIFHEFCHLKYKNHTKRFYELLHSFFDNYKAIEKNITNLKF